MINDVDDMDDMTGVHAPLKMLNTYQIILNCPFSPTKIQLH